MADQVNPRNLVVDILLEADRDDGFSDELIRAALDRYRELPRRDRAFIKRLSEGCIERRIELDFILDQFSNTKVEKMKPVIRAILRSGVYQLKYMDAVPDSAVCNEAVRLTSRRGFSGLGGFVNGVLRNIARRKDQIVYPSVEEDPVRALSVRYSMPEWITERFIASYGKERCESILAAFLTERPLCVRVDTRRFRAEEVRTSLEARGIRVEVDPRISCAFYLENCDRLEDIPEFSEGILYAQDVASMMVVETAQPRSGDLVLDVCAAPGGKTIQAAQYMGESGLVCARDLTEPRVELIRDNIRRCRVSNVRAGVWDARIFDPGMEGSADVVIADLPCSGLGVIRHKPDIKYNASEEKIRELVTLQREILSNAVRYVSPGGTLMYSTCTMTDEENRGNVRWLLERYPEFDLAQELELMPDEGCDGFYIAKMVNNT